MTIEECYERLSGDYKEVLSRLMDENRVKKFALRFLEVEDFTHLKSAIGAKDWEQAFISAHTLKGISLNLGFKGFTESISQLTEFLRSRAVNDENMLKTLFGNAESSYNNIIETLEQFKNEM